MVYFWLLYANIPNECDCSRMMNLSLVLLGLCWLLPCIRFYHPPMANTANHLHTFNTDLYHCWWRNQQQLWWAHRVWPAAGPADRSHISSGKHLHVCQERRKRWAARPVIDIALRQTREACLLRENASIRAPWYVALIQRSHAIAFFRLKTPAIKQNRPAASLN